MTLRTILLYTSVFSPLLALLAGLRGRKSLLWYYALVAIVLDVYLSIFMYENRQYKIVAANIFIVAEYILLSAYYGSRYIHKFQTVLLASFVVFAAAVVYTLAGLPETVTRFNSLVAGGFVCMYLVYTITGFYTLLQDKETMSIERSSFFWANVAFIIYAAGTLMLFALNSYYNEHNKALITKLWPLHNIFNILKNIFLAVALLVRKNKPWMKSSY